MKRFLLVARYYSIEPLGILYLAGLIRDVGWECKVVLIHESDFAPLYDSVRDWKPDLVGFQIWTGYHVHAFAACDRVRAMGTQVVIGGPHATYFYEKCAEHADYVIRAGAFGLLRRLLSGLPMSGVLFDKKGREDDFPFPDRVLVYDAYPELGQSSIKSLFASVGCPFECTYCYAPEFNQMHGGFALTVRPVSDIITEARAILARWPLQLIYFQDDVFGFDMTWLEEFARRWPKEVGVPFHCQIRLELTRHDQGNRRLNLFRQAGCTGITLAIESGNEFLRDQVLFRHMDDALILEGCKKITDRGLTLRTEQILAVPFSDRSTDLGTLALNNAINPTMAWTSILAPYAGTAMGTIAAKYGFYNGTNDDLSETFFDRSVLRHAQGGPRRIQEILGSSAAKKHALLGLGTRRLDPLSVEISTADGTPHVLHLLEDAENDRYCTDAVRLQRLFNWLSRVPSGHKLGGTLVDIPDHEWSWERVGQETAAHLAPIRGEDVLEKWRRQLAGEMGLPPESLPEPVAANPYYFCYLPAGGVLARQCVDRSVFTRQSSDQVFAEVGTLTRRHLFAYDLYKTHKGSDPIAT